MTEEQKLRKVREYWDRHLNCTQFLARSPVGDPEPGSEKFFAALEQVFEQYPYKDRLFQELASLVGGEKRLLEIGCGLGIELGKLARLGFEVTGVDLAPNAVAMANRYLQQRSISGLTQVGNAEALDFPDECFDAVYSSGVLHHTPDIEGAIGEIWRVLRPKGRILIVLYHRRSWFYILHRFSNVNVEFDDSDAPVINAYTEQELRSLFGRFESLTVEFEYYRPNPTQRRGFMAGCYNHIFVPIMRATPRRFAQRFGWHAVLTGTKKC